MASEAATNATVSRSKDLKREIERLQARVFQERALRLKIRSACPEALNFAGLYQDEGARTTRELQPPSSGANGFQAR